MGEKSDKSKNGGQTRHVPKDAQVIMSIMKDMGITEYEPRVINQLLEFTYRYVTCVMDDARVYANHAKKKVIDIDDVRIAVQMQVDKSFTTPPPREILLEVARSKNIIPLPLVKPHCGLRLPPDRYCLSACNYRLKPATKKPAPKPAVATPSIKTTTPKPLPGGALVKRQGPFPSGPPRVSTAPKPVLKFSSGNKVVAKPAIRVTSGPTAQPTAVKMEVDDSSNKRKRDDDYDAL